MRGALAQAGRQALRQVAAEAVAAEYHPLLAGQRGGGLVQLGFAWTPVTLFAGLALATVVLSLGELIVFPTFSVEVDQLTPDDLRGSYFGAANLYSLGTALAPLYGGIMLDHAGSQALYLGLAALCGVIMLLQVGAVGLRQAERAGG